MKKFLVLALATASALLPCARAQTLTGTVGTGPDASYLVIEATAFGSPLTFEYLYSYNPADPFDAYFLMTAIDTSFTDLEFTFINFGTLDEPNYFLDTISWQGTPLTNTGAPTFSPYWAQWVSGGEAGFPTAAPVASGSWSFGSGVSGPYRIIQPGSSDGFVFNDGSVAPSVAPVPEPTAAFLLLGSTAVFLIRRRARR
jgi:hypothetical protein